MFDSVLPQLIHSKARLFVVGIGDGAEHVITYMDRKMQDDPGAKIGKPCTNAVFTECLTNVIQLY